MAKTTIYIALNIGAQEPAYPAYVSFRSPYRFVSGAAVVLPEPSPVALAEDGTGTIAVDPGVWIVDEILPTQTLRRALLVPASSTTVNYSSLVEVSDPVEIGYGPTWAATALAAAGAAHSSAAQAESSADAVNALLQTAIEYAEAISGTGVLVLKNSDPDPVWMGTPTPFFRYDAPADPDDPIPALLRGVYHAANGTTVSKTISVDLATPSVGVPALADDILIAIVQNDTSISATPTLPAGWTRFIPTNLAGITGTMGTWCFWKVREPGENSVLVTLSEARYCALTVLAVSGEAFTSWTVGVVKARYETPTETNTTTAPSVTSARPASLALAIAMERTSAAETDLTSATAGWDRVAFFPATGSAIGTLALYKRTLSAPGSTGDFVATYPNVQNTNGVGFQLVLGEG